jgi:hypothetical protein
VERIEGRLLVLKHPGGEVRVLAPPDAPVVNVDPRGPWRRHSRRSETTTVLLKRPPVAVARRAAGEPRGSQTPSRGTATVSHPSNGISGGAARSRCSASQWARLRKSTGFLAFLKGAATQNCRSAR